MKILVYLWIGKANCGDESYRMSFPRLFSDHELTFTDHLTAELIESHDAFILGGGNILDIHHVGCVNRFAHLLKDKSTIAFSVGFTDTRVQSSQLQVFDKIYVRDYPAVDRLKLMHKNVVYCPDAAFGLEVDKDNGKKLWKEYFVGRDLYEKRVAVVCNSHLVTGGGEILSRDALRFQVFANDLANIMDHTNASFMMVPFGCASPWDDRVANGWVGSQCKWFRKNVTVYDALSVQNTMDVLGAADVVVSMRYHATVFSVLGGVPFLDIYHHDKNRSFLKTLGLESWGISYWDFSRERAKEIIDMQLAGGVGESHMVELRDRERGLLREGVDGIRFNK